MKQKQKNKKRLRRKSVKIQSPELNKLINENKLNN